MLNDGAAMRNKDTDREKIFLNRKLASTSKSSFFSNLYHHRMFSQIKRR